LFRASMPTPRRAEPDRRLRQSAARGGAAARDGERSEGAVGIEIRRAQSAGSDFASLHSPVPIRRRRATTGVGAQASSVDSSPRATRSMRRRRSAISSARSGGSGIPCTLQWRIALWASAPHRNLVLEGKPGYRRFRGPEGTYSPSSRSAASRRRGFATETAGPPRCAQLNRSCQ
jgi:hypothetical protein